MLLLIGDAFGSDLGTYINGTVISLRVKGDRLALWLKKIDDFDLIKSIGLKLKDLLHIPPDMQLIYEVSGRLHVQISIARPLVSRAQVRRVQPRRSSAPLKTSENNSSRLFLCLRTVNRLSNHLHKCSSMKSAARKSLLILFISCL